MRIFAVPAAVLLACCLYLPLPLARNALYAALRRLYTPVLRAFSRKGGKADDTLALIAFLLLMMGALLLAALHPLVAAVLMALSFTGLSVLPSCAKIKAELDAGTYARDIPAYEALVRETCTSVAPAFSKEVFAPLILCAAGMPLHMGPSLALAYAALCALSDQQPLAARIAATIQRFASRVFRAFILLCSGVVGRNPLRTQGRSDEARLLSILGIGGDGTDTHAPMAGDIPQGIFLCGFAAAVLGFALTAVGFVLCR